MYTNKKGGWAFEVNKRVVYVFRATGKGRNGAAKFCELMKKPPQLQRKSYIVQESHLNSAARKVETESMTQAAAEIHSAVENQALAEGYISAEGHTSAEGHISAVGTWQKRGYSSLHGITHILSMETGKPLDTEILTQFCKQ